MSPISMIVALSHKSFGIGANNKIPWNIPEDRARFRQITMGHTLLMGRHTFNSLGNRPLLGRFNVVVSSKLKEESGRSETNLFFIDQVETEPFFEETTTFVIGGSRLYQHYMGIASKIYATIVEKEFDTFDTFFPPIIGYKIESVEPRTWSVEEQCYYRFITYTKTTEPPPEDVFINLMREILTKGVARPDRTGVGTLSIFARQLHFDISDSIPLLTTRALGFKTILKELLWFLSGSSDSKELEAQGVHIWSGNTSRAFLDSRGLTNYKEGETGPLYGHALRKFGAPYKENKNTRWWSGKPKKASTFDQLNALVESIQNDPFSRRHLMTTFNPAVVKECVLAPCHGIAIQFYVNETSTPSTYDLSCHVYCRSSDTFLGLPFNIASYAVLVYIIAKKCSSDKQLFQPRELIISTGDTHIYSNHTSQAWTQVSRAPLPAPQLIIKDHVKTKDWNAITADDFELVGYLSHAAIKADMAI